MSKIFIPLFFICCFQFSKAQTTDTLHHKFEFKSLYRYAIQEDIKSILLILDTLSVTQLTESDLVLTKKYIKRFTTKVEIFDYNTSDRFLMEIIDIYRPYWTSILLKQKSIGIADTILKQNLSKYLIKKNRKLNNWNQVDLRADPMKYLSLLLTKKGYFNNVDGKTGNLFDIYIWKTQDTTNFNVQLPDDYISVPVLFMKDIITLGWEEYATFGVHYPGGWPRDSVLYCVAKAYDITKEKFLVSYLTHEAQHFLDLKKYEKIPSWHLEYRAKLAELCKANETMIKLLTSFCKGAKNDSTLSHPYAEYLVIRNLSQRIFKEDFVTDIEKWKRVEISLLNQTSTALLRHNTSLLIFKNKK